jgi:branched-subunit amino acid aminotransferase/4-amino-4-deoxychorismate lyase
MTTLIETIRVRNGVAPLWSLHLRRLEESCRILGIPFPSALEVPAGGEDRVHRLEVGSRGMQLTTRAVGSTAPVRLLTTGVPHLRYRFKTTERIQFDRAAEEARRGGADDGLLLTSLGEVAEATIWCLFWWEGDTLCAPALDLGILPGVSRLRIEELHGPVAERSVGRRALTGQPIFLANAVRGVVEVASLDRAEVPRHPGTAALREGFWA